MQTSPLTKLNLTLDEEDFGTEIFKGSLQYKAELSLVNYGVRIGIRSNDVGILERIQAYLPPGWEPSPSPVVDEFYLLTVEEIHKESRYQLYRAEEKLIETTKLDEAFDTFDSDLRLQVAIAAQDKLFVHAGVVGWQGDRHSRPQL